MDISQVPDVAAEEEVTSMLTAPPTAPTNSMVGALLDNFTVRIAGGLSG